jgi:hypothetical protein
VTTTHPSHHPSSVTIHAWPGRPFPCWARGRGIPEGARYHSVRHDAAEATVGAPARRKPADRVEPRRSRLVGGGSRAHEAVRVAWHGTRAVGRSRRWRRGERREPYFLYFSFFTKNIYIDLFPLLNSEIGVTNHDTEVTRIGVMIHGVGSLGS